jgi:hypothetical protein
MSNEPMDNKMIACGTAANTTVPTTAIRRTTFPRRVLPMKKRQNLKSPVGSSSRASYSSPSSSSSSSSSSSTPATEFSPSSTQEAKAPSDGDHGDNLKAALLLLKASKMFPMRTGQGGGGGDSVGTDVRGKGRQRCASPPRINDVLMMPDQTRGEDNQSSRGEDTKVANDDEDGTRAMFFHHIGNRRFRVLVEASLSNYFPSEDEIGDLIRGGWPAERPPGPLMERRRRVALAVIDSVRGNSPPGRFLVCSRRQINYDDGDYDDEDEDGLCRKVATEFEIEGMVHSTFWRAGRFCYYLNRTPTNSVEREEGEVVAIAHEKKTSDDPIASSIVSIRENQQRHLQRRKATTAMVETSSAPVGKKSRMALVASAAPSHSASLPIAFSPYHIVDVLSNASPTLMTSSPSAVMTPPAEKTGTSPHPHPLPPVPSPTPPESIRNSISSAEGSATANAARKVVDSMMSLRPSSRLKIFFSLPIEKFFVDGGGGHASSSKCENHYPLPPSAIDRTPYIVPTNYDVLCGPGRSFFHHVGNRRFRIMIEMNMERYKAAYLASLASNASTFFTNDGVLKLVDEILLSLSTSYPPTRFLGMDMSTGRWRALNPVFSQLKTEETFFECLQVGQLREARHREEESTLIECQKKGHEEDLNLNGIQNWRHEEEATNSIECQKMTQIEHTLPNNGGRNDNELQKQHEEEALGYFIECENKKSLLELEQCMMIMCGSGSGGDGRQVVTDKEMPQNAHRVLNNTAPGGALRDHVSKLLSTQQSHSFLGESNLQSLLKQDEISQLFVAATAAGMLQQLQQREAAQKISQPLFQSAFASALRSILSNSKGCSADEVVPKEQDQPQPSKTT